MESYYLIVVISLVILAISDLVVGVSNDAVNFLNSAFGSKVATRKTILIVASVGIAFGAVSSSGMMEIARKGIFNPEMFNFADIMVIFLAVMVTDIILLDLFNTFGMPTSTTISIMFELLGAAFIMASIKIYYNAESFSTLGNYLNSDNAILIISGIFLSVLIAFTFGVVVQHIVRLIFSFNLTETLKKYGPIFGGLAITTIIYFLLIKGLKGSSLISSDVAMWIQNNTALLLGIVLVFWTIASYLLARFFAINILKLVVLAGTFSLAMAFAGNDLVNFIGVPLAGVQSYSVFEGSGQAAESLNMAILGQEIHTNSLILLAAGLIMILTLWFSKKAQTVTETEINLSRESVGTERFKSNLLSRLIVRFGLFTGNMVDRTLSPKLKTKIDNRFVKNKETQQALHGQPAFDLVRASVNLMLASVLIAGATSLKLPLSTTYVSFMVAMGTSLADRAWDRDSAVYRISGVVNVISGWLFTALIAFTTAGVLTLVIWAGGLFAVIGLMGLTGFLVIRSTFLHKKLETKKNTALNKLMQRQKIQSKEVFDESEARISSTLYKIRYIIMDTIDGLATNDRKKILKAKKEVSSYQREYDDLTASFYYYLKKIDSKNSEEAQFYLHVINYLQNISQSVNFIGDKVFDHVNNLHRPMENYKAKELTALSVQMSELLKIISDLMGKDDKGNMRFVEDQSNELILKIDALEKKHIDLVRHEMSSPKNSVLYISILLEFKDILVNYNGLVGLYEKQEITPVVRPTGGVKIM